MKRRTVGGQTYIVRRVPRAELGGDDGECDVARAEIKVADDMVQRVAKVVEDHEVGHAACEESGAREILRRYAPGREEELEELLIQTWLRTYAAALK